MQRVVIGIGLATAEPVEPPASLKARVLANAPRRPRAPRYDASPVPGIQPKTTDTGCACTIARARPPGTRWRSRRRSTLAVALPASTRGRCARRCSRFARPWLSASAQADTLRGELAAARRDAAALRTTIRVLSAPDMIQVNLKGQGPAPNAIARGFWSRSLGLLFNAEGLPPIDLTRIYQLWVIKGGQDNQRRPVHGRRERGRQHHGVAVADHRTARRAGGLPRTRRRSAGAGGGYRAAGETSVDTKPST